MLVDKQMYLLATVVAVIGILTYQIENILRASNHPYVIPSIFIFGFVVLAIFQIHSKSAEIILYISYMPKIF